MKKAAAGLAIGLAGAALVLALNALFSAMAGGAGLTPLDAVELKTYDWRMRQTARPETARKDIALVEIDEYSLRNLETNVGRWPWPRLVHSFLIDYLRHGKPRAIAYDINFAGADNRRFEFGGEEWTGEQSDKALVDAVRDAGNVILLADATFEGRKGDAPPPPDAGYRLGGRVYDRHVIFTPFGDLARAAAALGHNLFVLDADGPLRHTIPFVRSEGRYLPLLGAAAALRAAGVAPSQVRLDREALTLGDRAMPVSLRRLDTSQGTQEHVWALIDFRGQWLEDLKTRPYPHYSFFDLIYSNEQILAGVKPNVDPSVFRDKIVFVGVNAASLFDAFETPFARGRMPGIQIHAAVADDILSNRFMRPAGTGVRLFIVLLCALSVGAIATLVPAWYATAATIALAAALAWIATIAFGNGLWINLSQPVLVMSLALFGGVSYQYFVEGREKRQVKRLFGRYVSKDIYDQLVANPGLARLGGQRREMTVLFSDIRGFTTVSESGEPEDVVAVLNAYFTRMVDIVFKHGGTLDKFVGDMVMALFGAPLDDPDHADHAVEAALEMIEELQRLNAEWQTEGRPALDIGIGINTGPMIAGNIGSEAIMSYTAIGDAVNLGSRLESLNKNYGTRIIISEATRSRLKGGYTFRPLGDVVVKGKTRAVPIFEVVARSEAPV
ncbi:MAG: adenylate/guanylate cyclase domain-containing protein [Acidobacteria bacterium]|nr:adenylate/guanylate cyclase domain-containing protein [Acidobacteriota bacterium]